MKKEKKWMSRAKTMLVTGSESLSCASSVTPLEAACYCGRLAAWLTHDDTVVAKEELL